MYGLDVVTTCSPNNHDIVRRLGAKHVFDYRDADVVSKIKQVAPGLKYVFDTIGNEASSATSSQAITETGGVLCTVRPGKVFTDKVTKQTKVTDVLVWTAFPTEHRYKDFVWPVSYCAFLFFSFLFNCANTMAAGQPRRLRAVYWVLRRAAQVVGRSQHRA